MIRFFQWLDDVLFSPPHRFEDVLRAVDALLIAEDPVYAAHRRGSPPGQHARAGEPTSAPERPTEPS